MAAVFVTEPVLSDYLESDPALAALTSRPGTSGKTHLEKHLAACEAEVDPSHARLWRRLLLRLGEMTPLPVQAVADAVMFFAPDGRYRMQVFALEDHKDGFIHVYLQDLLDEAVKEKVILSPNESGEYQIPNENHVALRVDLLDAANTKLPPPHVKNMLGWNRKALRVTLIASQADGPRVAAAEALCELAARKWHGMELIRYNAASKPR